jgi:hypothetical protein
MPVPIGHNEQADQRSRVSLELAGKSVLLRQAALPIARGLTDRKVGITRKILRSTAGSPAQ